MTEAEWLACPHPAKMLRELGGKVTNRKLRLFAVACCRGIWNWMIDKRSRKGVKAAERYADKLIGKKELQSAREATVGAYTDVRADDIHIYQTATAAFFTCCASKRRLRFVLHETKCAAMNFAFVSRKGELQEAREKRAKIEVSRQILLIRDIFGNPFRPLPPRPEAIAPLAERIYAGEWNLMPLLGEWLQEHGYWSEGEHCLDPKNHHVKGCWVVDWVMGRE